jgi:uncharacterized protein
MTLPTFRYHPDPLASGSVVPSDRTCRCCGEARGYVYAGPVYAEDDLDGEICPWCIADGAAHKKFGASFFDIEAIDEDVSDKAMDEICERTPGYVAWQQGRWPSCCDDATQFITPAGHHDVELGARREWLHSVMEHIVHEMGISGGAGQRMLRALNRDKGPTAYLFKCASCGKPHVHIDHT